MTIKTFIDRPVLSSVISIIIIILGILGFIALPVERFPEISPPTIVVSTSYPGADAQTVQNSVVVPLEEQINGVENMLYMTSSSSNEGTGTIMVYFKLGTNPDMAVVNTQNRVNRALSRLPKEVTQSGVSTSKRQPSMLLIYTMYSENGTYDDTFLQNYAKINIIPRIQRILGVGDVMVFGARDYSMRIWLKPDVMASYGLTPADVLSALNEQSLEAAPGKFGENGDQSFQYVIRYKGRLNEVGEYENIVIRAASDGKVLRLKDVARIELGAFRYNVKTRSMNRSSITFAINQTAGSNAQNIIKEVKTLMTEASKDFPEGIVYTPIMDTSEFLDASFEKVYRTLFEAFILVFLVVFIFLQDFRSTLIPAIAVPVALVGTFFVMNLIGFSLNLLTLFALVLAIAIVVDDAIVVVEAVHAKMERGEKSARDATVHAMDEITGAIISITLVMSAVFLPLTFIQGTAGVFYKQFGLTLAIAIIISAINALTLSPALCALLLTPHAEGSGPKKFKERFFQAFNTGFEAITNRYKRSVHFCIDKKWVPVGGLIVSLIVLIFLVMSTPTGFVPAEDVGNIFTEVIMPPATSLERTEKVMQELDSIVRSNPYIASYTRITGNGMISGAGSSYGMLISNLVPWKERPGKDGHLNAVIQDLTQKTSYIRDARIMIYSPPTVSGFGVTGGFEFSLQDKTGGEIREFYAVAQNYLAALNQRPEILMATTSFNPNFPQYMMDVNVVKCKEAGIPVTNIISTMQGYFGGIYAADFNLFGKQFRVMVQADSMARTSPASMNNIFVRNSKGEMAPITEYVSLNRVYGPEVIPRFNMFNSIPITGTPAQGYSSGDALLAIREVASQTLPAGYGFEFAGLSREEESTGQQAIYVFLLCLIFVYFLLCAQYESYILPLAVIFSLPLGIAGVFIAAKIMGLNNNIYLQIAMIMLIGLLAKNAILIVQFATDRRKRGMSIAMSAIGGASARLRPILMTSFALIFGLLPLMMSTGAGAMGNRSIGTGAIGGMLIGTLLGIFVIPTLYIIFQTLQEKIKKPKFIETD